jgi:signal transduction histidine kinase
MPEKRNIRAEWLVSHLRWAMLFVVFVLSSIDPLQRTNLLFIYGLLLVAGAHNLAVALLLYLKRTPSYLWQMVLAADTLFLIALTYLSGQPFYLLLSLFPIMVAAIQFSFEVSLLIASVVTFAHGIFIFFLKPWVVSGEGLLPTIISILTLFIGAMVGSLVSAKERIPEIVTDNGIPPSSAYRERFRAIYEMTGELIATLNYQLVLEKMLDVSLADFKEKARRNLQRPVSMVLFFDEDKGGMYVAAYRNLSKSDEQRRIKGETGLVGRVITAAEPAMSSRPNADPELSSFSALRRCRSVLCVPLRVGFDMYGVALFGSPEINAYSDVYMELVTAFCNQVSIALQNAELYEGLQEQKRKILVSDEELRKQLARELHDGPTQTISSIAMRLDFVRMLLEQNPAKAREELDTLERLAGQAVQEVRTMLFTMRPMILETQGLAAALEQFAQRIQDTDKIHVHLDPDRLDSRPVPHVEGAAFFILEEALNNARKHAQPKNIWINLAVQDGELLAQVKDDGEGFDLAQVESSYDERTSLGLVNMRERARLVNGVLTIESKRGQGTTVTLTAPMSGEEELP